jgi:hypothetical protein
MRHKFPSMTAEEKITSARIRLRKGTVRRGDDDCWLWNGYKNNKGYGQIHCLGHLVLAHRISYEEVNGPIPPGMFVLHSCDTPLCVNPKHLRIGTQKDNLSEASIKGRVARGSKNGQAKINEFQVKAIRADGRGNTQIAIDYGLSRRHVCDIKNRNRWKHL